MTGGTTPILKVPEELQTVMGTMGQDADPRTLATFGVAVRMSQRDGKVAALEEVTAKSRKLDLVCTSMRRGHWLFQVP